MNDALATSNSSISGRLWKNQKFLYLWFSSTTSFLALSTYLFAEQWYIVRVLDQEALLGVVLMVTMIPRIFLMTIGGVLADRFRRSRIMVISSLVRGVLMIGMMIFFQLSLLAMAPLIAFALCFGVVDAFFSPANSSLVPTLISKEKLTQANSFIQSSNQFAMFTGPILGGFVLTISSFSVLFATIAALLFLTSLFSFFIKEEAQIEKSTPSTKTELKDGFRYVWNLPFLKNILMIIIFINFFFFGPLLIGIPLIVDHALDGEPLQLSFMQSAYQGGMLTGALLIGVINLRRKRGIMILCLMTVLGICLSLLGMIHHLWQGMGLLGVMGLLSSVINVSLISTIQEQSRSDKIGRVMSIVNASSNGLVPLSYGFVSLSLLVHLSIPTVMGLCGLVITTLSVCYTFRSTIVRNID
ncbi:MFS transporter [Pontibacillus salipaludis]|uniref:MFS transporter n=1 Tax=Pontibacillus salipaludis TaxID=1697394 RepID=A0ABQ1Q0Q1_9BACI|nr:MFS transporter [Pontibacillus salipaludis]